MIQNPLQKNNLTKLLIHKGKGASNATLSTGGSICLEAALVLPLFMAAIISVMFFIQAAQIQMRVQKALYNQISTVSGYAHYIDLAGLSDRAEQMLSAEAVKMAVVNEVGRDFLDNSYVKDGYKGIYVDLFKDGENGMLDVKLYYKMEIPYNLFSLPNLLFESYGRCHTWVGKVTEDKNPEIEMVYITTYGTVYHLYTSCSYINSYIKYCDYKDISGKRNSSGGKYSQCQVCDKAGNDSVVFYTEYGSRYHSTTSCGNLHSNVYGIDRTVAEKKYRLCSKCAKR